MGKPEHVGGVSELKVRLGHAMQADAIVAGHHNGVGCTCVEEELPLVLDQHIRIVHAILSAERFPTYAVALHAQPADPHAEGPVWVMPVPAPAHTTSGPMLERVDPPNVGREAGVEREAETGIIGVPPKGASVHWQTCEVGLPQAQVGVDWVFDGTDTVGSVLNLLVEFGDPQLIIVAD